MDPELFEELTELIARWNELADQARTQAEMRPNSTYDGYMLGLELATDDLTRILGKKLRRVQSHEFDN